MRITVGGRGAKASCAPAPPISAASSSWTILTTCWPGLSWPTTSAPSARSLTRVVKSLTTRKLTSASSSARRISRMALLMSSSVSVPRERTSARVCWRRSERASNTASRVGTPVPLRARRRRTVLVVTSVKRATYLVLTFPLGTVWFIVLITALATGVSLAVTLLGFPVLVGTLYLLRPMAQAERRLIDHLLGEHIPGAYRRPVRGGIWPAIQTRLADAQTWKDLAYLLVQLPLGIVWTVVVLSDLVLLGAAAVVAAPVALVSRRAARAIVDVPLRILDLLAR